MPPSLIAIIMLVQQTLLLIYISVLIWRNVVGFLSVFPASLQAVSAIADIRKDIPIHLELASMTDKDYMSRIMQEVHVENNHVERSESRSVYFHNPVRLCTLQSLSFKTTVIVLCLCLHESITSMYTVNLQGSWIVEILSLKSHR